MPLRPILRLLLAGLLAYTALLAPWPGEGSHTPPLRVGYKVAHADGPGDWPMFGHDPAHTGFNAAETQLKPPLRLKWRYATSVPRIVVASGVVYVGGGSTVYALDAATGSRTWKYQTALGTAYPAVANGLVYANADHYLYALEASTGTLRWSYEGDCFLPVVYQSVVYGCSNGAKLAALEAATGALRWSYQLPSSPWTPAASDGRVYVPAYPGLYALDAGSGSLIWSYQSAAWVTAPAAANGLLYVGGRSDNKVHALDQSSWVSHIGSKRKNRV